MRRSRLAFDGRNALESPSCAFGDSADNVPPRRADPPFAAMWNALSSQVERVVLNALASNAALQPDILAPSANCFAIVFREADPPLQAIRQKKHSVPKF